MAPDGTDAPDDRRERLRARGHENVQATHESTLEVTTDDWLTPAGDCIVGVAADRAPADFSGTFVSHCRDPDARISLTLQAGDCEATVTGRGHPALSFESDRSAVVRTSDYVDDRTVMVEADVAAADLDRGLVDALATGEALDIVVTVQSGE